ncbi:MAG: hypothetical protein JNN07_07480 [Verrucomicrobiales bacterium]|nr:hypothetical protein [Verrucomicrobiales bacterium]
MSHSESRAQEYARRFISTTESEFMAYTPDDFAEDVVVDGRPLRVTAKQHIVKVLWGVTPRALTDGASEESPLMAAPFITVERLKHSVQPTGD